MLRDGAGQHGAEPSPVLHPPGGALGPPCLHQQPRCCPWWGCAPSSVPAVPSPRGGARCRCPCAVTQGGSSGALCAPITWASGTNPPLSIFRIAGSGEKKNNNNVFLESFVCLSSRIYFSFPLLFILSGPKPLWSRPSSRDRQARSSSLLTLPLGPGCSQVAPCPRCGGRSPWGQRQRGQWLWSPFCLGGGPPAPALLFF